MEHHDIQSWKNYKAQHHQKTVFLAESSANTLINDRQKRKKMQWTRTGAHNILQIRTSAYSNHGMRTGES